MVAGIPAVNRMSNDEVPGCNLAFDAHFGFIEPFSTYFNTRQVRRSPNWDCVE